VDEMLVAGEPWLPQYGEAIDRARRSLEGGFKVPHRPVKGCFKPGE